MEITRGPRALMPWPLLFISGEGEMETVNHNQVKAMFAEIGLDDHLAEYLARDIVNIDLRALGRDAGDTAAAVIRTQFTGGGGR